MALHRANDASTVLQRLVRGGLLAPVLLGLAAFGVRALGLTRSFELWVDEMVYTDLGVSVAHGQLPSLSGQPFFLHPPGAFLLEGLVVKVFGLTGTSMDITYDLRWVNAVLGALTVALGFVLVRRITGTGPAWACGALLALDPFVLRNNSRVFLETPATLAVVGGLLVLVWALDSERGLSAKVAVPAGLLLGYGVLTKDALAVFAAVPVVLAVLWRRTLKPREALTVLVASLVPYLSYLAVVGLCGLLGGWWQSKASGLERMIGLKQTTGFNAPNAPSLVDRLVAQLGQFGTSYVLLLLCPIAGLVAALSTDRRRRLIGLCAVSMGGFGMYAALFGTFEEQYGYGVMVAGTLALGPAAVEVVQRWPRLTVPLRVGAALLVAVSLGLALRAELTPDDGFVRVRAWVHDNLPAGARVGVTNSTGQWAFKEDARFGVWPSARSMLDHHADYILTQSLPTSQGYGYAKPIMLDWLRSVGKPLLTFQGPTNGQTVLWQVPADALTAGARAGVGS